MTLFVLQRFFEYVRKEVMAGTMQRSGRTIFMALNGKQNNGLEKK